MNEGSLRYGSPNLKPEARTDDGNSERYAESRGTRPRGRTSRCRTCGRYIRSLDRLEASASDHFVPRTRRRHHQEGSHDAR